MVTFAMLQSQQRREATTKGIPAIEDGSALRRLCLPLASLRLSHSRLPRRKFQQPLGSTLRAFPSLVEHLHPSSRKRQWFRYSKAIISELLKCYKPHKALPLPNPTARLPNESMAYLQHLSLEHELLITPLHASEACNLLLNITNCSILFPCNDTNTLPAPLDIHYGKKGS